ncbi:MAG: MBL fold metallo-hydrolase, partial [Gemmatimonadota bacterium]|nr:MBL fold metallo-hydrolase [Gemmatimonadota bacterium]
MRLSFLGAAGTVTGSRHFLVAGGKRILVDCGLFQGLKVLRLRNREALTFDSSTLDAVVLTHAHLDHSGFLPVLVKAGFSGPIYCTGPTADLVPILLRDSGRIQEEDARYANRKGF